MMKCIFNIAAVILLFLPCCQSISSIPSANEGQVSLYLSTISEPHSNIIFILEKIEAENDSGKWFTLFHGKKEVNSENLIGQQILVSETSLATGKYRKMKLSASDAIIIREGKRFNLALPKGAEDIILDMSFQVYANECTAFFLRWDTEESIENKYLFKPAMTLNQQKMEIRDLILYVTNSASNSVTVINRQNDQVVGIIGVGRSPMGIIASPSGDSVYVANAHSNTVSVIDTSYHIVTDTIQVNSGTGPRELAVSPDGRMLLVSNYISNNICIIDTVSKSQIGQVPVGSNPLGIAINESGNRVYVVNSSSNSLSVIDPFLVKVIKTATLGSNPTDLLIDRNKIFVTNSGTSNVYQINANSFLVEKETVAGFGSHNLIKDLNGNIYVSNMNSNDISIIPFSTNITIQKIPVENFPQKMAIDHSRKKLYVANGGSNSISVIDLVRNKLIMNIPVGKRPYGLTVVE